MPDGKTPTRGEAQPGWCSQAEPGQARSRWLWKRKHGDIVRAPWLIPHHVLEQDTPKPPSSGGDSSVPPRPRSVCGTSGKRAWRRRGGQSRAGAGMLEVWDKATPCPGGPCPISHPAPGARFGVPSCQHPRCAQLPFCPWMPLCISPQLSSSCARYSQDPHILGPPSLVFLAPPALCSQYPHSWFSWLPPAQLLLPSSHPGVLPAPPFPVFPGPPCLGALGARCSRLFHNQV